MPVYEYIALDARGRRKTGILDAESPFAARERLRGDGIYPTEIRETQQGSPDAKAGRGKSLSSPFSRVGAAHVTVMTRQLATLVGAGLPLVTALETLIPQFPQPRLKRVLAQVKDSIVEGNSLAGALAQHPRVFPSLYVNMVRAGEASGALEIVLDRLAELFERQQASRARIFSAMLYPVIMMCIGILVLVVMLTFIMPAVLEIFEESKQALPLPTQMLLGASAFFRHYWWALLILLIGGVVGVTQTYSTKQGRVFYDRMILKIPLIRDLSVKLSAASFSRTLASLVQNGVALVPALGIVQAVIENRIIKKAVENAAEQVSEGRGLAESIRQARVFPPIAVQMMEVGEQSGELESMLERVADLYQTEAETTIDRLTTLLEPLMIIMLAGGVGFMVISILLPILEMSSQIH